MSFCRALASGRRCGTTLEGTRVRVASPPSRSHSRPSGVSDGGQKVGGEGRGGGGKEGLLLTMTRHLIIPLPRDEEEGCRIAIHGRRDKSMVGSQGEERGEGRGREREEKEDSDSESSQVGRLAQLQLQNGKDEPSEIGITATSDLRQTQNGRDHEQGSTQCVMPSLCARVVGLACYRRTGESYKFTRR